MLTTCCACSQQLRLLLPSSRQVQKLWRKHNKQSRCVCLQLLTPNKQSLQPQKLSTTHTHTHTRQQVAYLPRKWSLKLDNIDSLCFCVHSNRRVCGDNLQVANYSLRSNFGDLNFFELSVFRLFESFKLSLVDWLLLFVGFFCATCCSCSCG